MINTYSNPNLVFVCSAGGIREPRCTSFSNLGPIKGTSIIIFYIGICQCTDVKPTFRMRIRETKRLPVGVTTDQTITTEDSEIVFILLRTQQLFGFVSSR